MQSCWQVLWLSKEEKAQYIGFKATQSYNSSLFGLNRRWMFDKRCLGKRVFLPHILEFEKHPLCARQPICYRYGHEKRKAKHNLVSILSEMCIKCYGNRGVEEPGAVFILDCIKNFNAITFLMVFLFLFLILSYA